MGWFTKRSRFLENIYIKDYKSKFSAWQALKWNLSFFCKPSKIFWQIFSYHWYLPSYWILWLFLFEVLFLNIFVTFSYYTYLYACTYVHKCPNNSNVNGIIHINFFSSQPMCDGTHLIQQLRIPQKPIVFYAPETKEVWLCNCKQTKNPPFCDGTHRNKEIQSAIN